MYAVSGNESATRCGIDVDKVIMGFFHDFGPIGCLAGILMTGRLDHAVTTQGQNIIFSAFAAAVIGGVSLGGGQGTITGVLSGVLLIGVINNLLTLSADVSSFYVQATTGAIIILSAILSTLANKRSSLAKTRT